MKKLNTKIISTFLAILMLASAMTGLFTVSASAAGDTNSARDNIEAEYTQTDIKTPEDKIAKMKKMLENQWYELFADAVSGEVAVREKATGEILFTNPYDVGSSSASVYTKEEELLSQIIIKYSDTTGGTGTLYSFIDAAMRQQITVLPLKGSVRVEYTIGEEQSRKLVPRQISKERFDEFIYGPVKQAYEEDKITYKQLTYVEEYYTLKSLSKFTTNRAKSDILSRYPICAEMDIYVYEPKATDAEINCTEETIKLCCQDYSFEMMDEDHDQTGFVAKDSSFPVFKLALEYSLDKDGLVVRMPCNGLRYDTSTYTLENIQILPYIGAGVTANGGYNFFPDGSGTLFDYEQVAGGAKVMNKIYGLDFAYQTLGDFTYQRTIRYPVYGLVANEEFYNYSYTYVDETTNQEQDSGNIRVSKTVMSLDQIREEVEGKNGKLNYDPANDERYSRGFVAIIEEGESLGELATYHAGAYSEYNTFFTYFNPKPKDSYDLADSISVMNSSSSTKWTVVSDRKYTGSIKIRYKMLTDPAHAAAAKTAEPNRTYYNTSWVGMAEFYRDYLIENGTLTRLKAADVEQDIPLYIESFGALETQQSIATIPVKVMTPLTTFDDVQTMYRELSEAGVKNINFKLTGFANGGMYSTVPAALKWESKVGGKSGFKDLVAFAEETNEAKDSHLGIYPDFDFEYINRDKLFDSTNLKDDAVKTIDNRYTSKRIYSATMQMYVSFYQLAISPARFSKFYNKLMTKYEKYGNNSISLSTFGNTLNSNFDEDDPLNRVDSQEFTVEALQNIQNYGDQKYSLMVDGGNAYTWAYANHIVNMDLDSSHFIGSYCTVPFLGMVLHGFVQFAGAPLNEEGNIDYAILKAIENGAGMYFMLSYNSDNTTYLKEDTFLNQYYSVRYDIWKEDVVKYYKELNTALKDVQTKLIVDHEFLNTDVERVLSLKELEAQIEEKMEDAIIAEEAEKTATANASALAIAKARLCVTNLINGRSSELQTYRDALAAMKKINAEIQTVYDELKGKTDVFATTVSDAVTNADLAPIGTEIDAIKNGAVKVMKLYADLQVEKHKVDVAFQALKDNLAAAEVVLTDTTDLNADVKTKYLAEVSTAKGILTSDIPTYESDIAGELAAKKACFDGTTDSAEKLAIGALALMTTENPDFADAMATLKEEHTFTEAEITAFNVPRFDPEPEPENDDEDTEDVVENPVDANMVVAVSYGESSTQKSKTFLLNYNNYAIRVTYHGLVYTIPSNGFVTIDINN